MTPLEAFAAQLGPRARVYCLRSEDRAWFEERGISVECAAEGKDVRLLSLQAESWDGIWAGPVFGSYNLDEAQRVLATFFKGLRPARGIVYARHAYEEEAFSRLLRQNGFQTVQAAGTELIFKRL